jgi:hypothetical protein
MEEHTSINNYSISTSSRYLFDLVEVIVDGGGIRINA